MFDPVVNDGYQEEHYFVSNQFSPVIFSGQVVNGLGRGTDFVSLSGYAKQFRERLGYDPYPGTLNVTVENGNRAALDMLDSIRIDGWEDGKQSFGPVRCYPATIHAADSDVYEQTHVIVPVKTDHNGETLELLAPNHIRGELNLTAGSSVCVIVGERST